MASSDLNTLYGYTSNPENAPQPPPKPASTTQTPIDGPPLPPPPPSQPLSSTTQQQQEQTLQQTPFILPPESGEDWLPQALRDKTSQQLEPIFRDQELLKALAQQHHSVNPSPLPPYLQQTQALATHVSTQYQQLLALRQQTQSHLLHLHLLERQWREKQTQMDRQLEPWSAKNLYQRLREKEREEDEWSVGLERSWLEGEGEVGEREVVEFLRGFREGKGRVWRRREERERWDEGRVGGWR